MFTFPVIRVVRAAACTSKPTTRPIAAATHQRRYSSSKTSIPPNGPSSRGRSSAPSQQASNSAPRVRSRKGKGQTFSQSTYANLPRVPPTQHLHPADINISSFFSLHRPISVTAAVPQATTSASFATIFEPRRLPERHPPSEVMQTLYSVVESLEPSEPEESRDGWQAQEYDQSSVPRDIPLQRSGEALRPYFPPPPPVMASERRTSPAQRSKELKGDAPLGSTSWATTIVVTEHTAPSGKKSYMATCTPFQRTSVDEDMSVPSAVMVEEPAPVEDVQKEPGNQPFLNRMWIRQERWEDMRRGTMFAISVRRQRKLKMKKHKYKKLMKRTRILRRRLGRL